MSGTTKIDCTNKEDHHLHLCQLKKQGLNAEIAVRTDDPEYLCHNCNASANLSEDLCNPSRFIKRR
jgi:hypothetical protein